ncbi:MAG: exosome complex protein Rrp42 [Nanoarchaeota archaeon]|nr:exosome complex protein Rrp42 [Nanoarchaeota archaeon]
MTLENNIKKRIIELASEGKRIDGRKLEETRKIEIIYDISNQAEGSCHVKLGKTEVMVGVKLGLGEPYPDTPDAGNLIVNAEVTALAGKEYEPGPPKEEVITMARVVDRGVRESGCVDMKKLVITKGERIWTLFIDAYVINDAGNLIDASAIGALAALKKAMMPVYNKKDDKIEITGNHVKMSTKKLPIAEEPIAITIAKVGDYLLPDPTKEENQVSDATLTITLNKKDKGVSLQKGGSEGFTKTEFEKALKIAIKNSKDIRAQIK